MEIRARGGGRGGWGGDGGERGGGMIKEEKERVEIHTKGEERSWEVERALP